MVLICTLCAMCFNPCITGEGPTQVLAFRTYRTTGGQQRCGSIGGRAARRFLAKNFCAQMAREVGSPLPMPPGSRSSCASSIRTYRLRIPCTAAGRTIPRY